MIPAYSLDSILKEVDKTLAIKHKRRPIPAFQKRLDRGHSERPVMAWMVPGELPFEVDGKVGVEEECSKLIGVLFCGPSSKVGKDEVLPHLDYFHYRSALFVDFFCIGYGAYWPQENDTGNVQQVAKVGDVQWLFNTP